jgi:transcriptional repressor NrdR
MANFNIGDSRVIESREVGDGMTIRRRRETTDGRRFTTYERVEKPNLAVIKKNGSRELYDRDKLSIAIKRSVGKFFTSEVEVEEMINDIEDRLYALGESEITSRQIGEVVLDELAKRNEVAFVRFASVFHEFKTLDDFVHILEQRLDAKKQNENAA